MANSRKLLFLTNSEYGQASVILATAYQLALDGFDIHVASFAPLESRIPEIEQLLKHAQLDSYGITFHVLPGTAMVDKWSQKKIKLFHGPGVHGVLKAYSSIPEVLAPWNLEEYSETYRACCDLIESLNPRLCIVDSLFSQGIDAAFKSMTPCVIFNAISHRNILLAKQPLRNVLFSYSPAFSGIPLPLAWYHMLCLTPLWLAMVFAYVVYCSDRLKRINTYRRAEGLGGVYPAFKKALKRVQYLCPSLPETDPYFPNVPENVVLCGPVLLPSLSTLNDDLEFSTWLRTGPTILINTGTLAELNSSWVNEMAAVIRETIQLHKGIQVIWKLKTDKKLFEEAKGILRDDISRRQVQLLEWMEISPSRLLESGHIICSVHHGGANTFYEAAWNGVPQIILPTWFDTYDFAVRAEHIGVGIYGNKSSAPGINRLELGSAMTKVVEDVQNQGPILKNARALGEACKRSGGRATAAESIKKLCDQTDSKLN